MRKIYLLLIFALSTALFAQEAAPMPYTPHQKKQNISVEYGVVNFTDFIWMISTGIGKSFKGNDDDDLLLLGDISVNYGYEVGKRFETGLIVNFAIPDTDLFFFSIMPRAKLNFNSEGFVNPYVELDVGVMVSSSGGASIMAHSTAFGLEIGSFYFQILGFGQRGMFYAGYKYKF